MLSDQSQIIKSLLSHHFHPTQAHVPPLALTPSQATCSYSGLRVAIKVYNLVEQHNPQQLPPHLTTGSGSRSLQLGEAVSSSSVVSNRSSSSLEQQLMDGIMLRCVIGHRTRG